MLYPVKTLAIFQKNKKQYEMILFFSNVQKTAQSHGFALSFTLLFTSYFVSDFTLLLAVNVQVGYQPTSYQQAPEWFHFPPRVFPIVVVFQG